MIIQVIISDNYLECKCKKRMNKGLSVDIEKCSGCRMCELVCAFNKEKRVVPDLARITVWQNYSQGISTPVFCTHCDNAPCIEICPTKALSKDSVTGIVNVNEKTCKACRLCAKACKTGAISFNAKKKKIYKCNLCDGDPICVKFCPTGALTYTKVINISNNKRYNV